MTNRAARRRADENETPTVTKKSPFPIQLLPVVAIIALGILNYANSFVVPFQYDDRLGILNNTALHNLWNLRQVLLDARAGEVRPLVSLSFALNYSWGGVNTVGYHLVNLILHLSNAILVYFFLRRIYELASGGDRSLAASPVSLPAAVAATLFVSHPIQTETVTYIWGRSDLLHTFFSLLTLLCFAQANSPQEFAATTRPQAKEARRRSLYFFAALGSFVFALGSKAAAVSLPLLLSAFDYYFVSRGDVKKWWSNLRSFHATFIILAGVRVGLHYLPKPIFRLIFPRPPGEIAFFTELEPWDERPSLLVNILTQCQAVLHYLQLLFFPVDLTVDHDLPFAQSFFAPTVLASLGMLAVLIAAVFFLYSRAKIVSFGLCWILLTLSFFFFFPLPDAVVERRLYLPSVGFCLCLATGLHGGARYLSERWSREGLRMIGQLAPAALLIAWYTVATMERNTLWHDPYILWSDAVQKAPDKARTRTNLAIVSIQQGKFQEAIWAAKAALFLNPAVEKARYCLLDAYANLRRQDLLLQAFRETLYAYPYYAIRWYLWQPEALQRNSLLLHVFSQFEKDLARTGGNADSHIALGFLYFKARGDGQRALWHFEEGLKFTPERFRINDMRRVVEDLKGRLSRPQGGKVGNNPQSSALDSAIELLGEKEK